MIYSNTLLGVHVYNETIVQKRLTTVQHYYKRYRDIYKTNFQYSSTVIFISLVFKLNNWKFQNNWDKP